MSAPDEEVAPATSNIGDDTGSIRASDDPDNRGQVAGDAASDDPDRHEHRSSADTVDGAEVVATWLAEDPDPETQAELRDLLARGDTAEIAARFAGRLEFGTAGLRGPLGAGPMRMNRSVVLRAAAGLVGYVQARGGRSVVIGYDARHKSDVFAEDTAAVVRGAGLDAHLLPRPLPTPVLAFAIRHVGADAGVMVTASHNPPQDNGYKVYLGDGAQIAPPTDAEISAYIDAVGPLVAVPRAEGAHVLGDDLVDAYVARAAGVVGPDSPRELSIVYTPLHGVGRDVVLRVFERAGFSPPHVVPAQSDPDPDFPTVAFPNPEEPGAMDLAFAAAEQRGADLVLANDPDADRCAAGVRTADGWRMLRGDEVGALLAGHLIACGTGSGGTFATTIVSSTLMRRLGERHGVAYAETLTGFKWLARVDGLRYAYEEALGYCVDPDGVRDKDGMTAALLLAEVAATAKAAGRSLADLLDDLAREHGVHATDQLSVRVSDLSLIAATMQTLRARPPSELGGRAVTSVEDLSIGDGDLPATDALRLTLDGGGRVVVRPSGTEPKLKAYLEVVSPVAAPAGDAGDSGTHELASARAAAARTLAAMKHDLTAALGL